MRVPPHCGGFSFFSSIPFRLFTSVFRPSDRHKDKKTYLTRVCVLLTALVGRPKYWWTIKSGIVVIIIVSLLILPVTLQGTYAWHLAITWGKPVFFQSFHNFFFLASFGCFSLLLFGLLVFSLLSVVLL